MFARTFLAASVLFASTLGLPALAQEEARTWTDSTGTFKVTAKLIAVAEGVAKLEKADGTTVDVPLARLSGADRRVVAKWKKEAGAAAKSPQGAPASDGAAQPAQPGEWPTWRGPSRDGISQETGLLSEWPEGGPPLLWTATGIGTGYGSLAVSNGKIYVGGRTNGEESLHALDATSGNLLWSTRLGPGSREKGTNGTPTVHDGRVFAMSFEGDLVAADASSGDEIWRKSFQRDFGGRMMSGWGYSESPLADGERLICTPGGDQAMVVALDQATGAPLWRAPMPPGGSRGKDGAGYSSVVISNAGGVKQYVQLVGRGVIGVAASDGKMLWGYDGVANGTANVPTPIVSGDLVFCSSGYDDGGSALLQIGRGGARALYTKRPNEVQNHHGGMILLDGKIYMGHGHNNGLPLCLDMQSGRILWGPERGAGSGSAALAYADGHLYFRYQDGAMALVEASPQGYSLKGEFRERVRDQAWPQPVIAGKKLYLRDQDTLRCYDIAKK